MSIRLEIMNGGLQGRSFTVDQTEIWLGRESSCTVAFDPQRDDSVGRRHACIRRLASGSWSVENLHENGTLLNGNPITSVQNLKSGDVLRLATDGPEIRVSMAVYRQALPAGSGSPASPHTIQSATLPETEPTANIVRVLPWLCAGGISVPLIVLAVVLLRGQSTSRTNAGPTPAVEGENTQPASTPSITKTTPGPDTNPQRPAGAKIPIAPTVQAAPAKAPPSDAPTEELCRRYENAVVWLGVETDSGSGATVFIGNGWAVAPDLIVTSAKKTQSLQEYRKQAGRRIVVFAKGQSGSIAAKEFKPHPRFDGSYHYDVGLVVLEKPLSVTCPQRASEAQLITLDEDAGLRVLGYTIRDQNKPVSELNAPQLVTLEGRVRSVLALPSSQRGFPTLKLTVSAPESAEGCAVFAASGTVAGVLLSGTSNKLVPCDRLSELVN